MGTPTIVTTSLDSQRDFEAESAASAARADASQLAANIPNNPTLQKILNGMHNTSSERGSGGLGHPNYD